MARIRTIKPEFPQSETTGKLSRDARLLFILLWTIADDEGRTRAASRMLASLLFPYDDDAPKLLDGWLAELASAECVRVYEVDGSHYLEIVNWLKHQKIDRPSPSKIPPFDAASAKPREHSRALAADLVPGPRTLDLGTPSLRSGVDAPLAQKPKKALAVATRLPEDFVPDIDEAIRIGLTREQATTEGDNFRDYWTAKAGNATKRDWPATWRVWCRKATTNPQPRINGNGNGHRHPTAHESLLASFARAAEERSGDHERQADPHVRLSDQRGRREPDQAELERDPGALATTRQ